jgi:hypothetical protein
MDRSKVKEIVEASLGPLVSRLGIDRWTIGVDYDLRESDGLTRSRGLCNWHPDYDKASINLDPDSFGSEEEVAKVLRHELFHVLLAPYTVFLNAVKPLMQDDPIKAAMAEAIWTHACERAVINLERMYVGLTSPGDRDP